MNLLSALLPKPKKKKLVTWPKKNLVHVVEFYLHISDTIGSDSTKQKWQFRHPTATSVITAPPGQADGEPGESSASFLWVQGFKVQSTLQIQVWGRKPATAPRQPHHVYPALNIHAQRGFIPTKEHLCVHYSPPQSYLLWSKGILVKMGHLHSISFLPLALSFLSFAPHSYRMVRALMAQQL